MSRGDDGNQNQEAPVGPLSDAEKKAFEERMVKLVGALPPDSLSKLSAYQSELLKFNRAVNLVSPNTARQADILHFSDSILASRIIFKALVSKEKLFDVGSGNGFPGLVLAILGCPVPVVLVDRDKRKAEFLKHMIATLKLSSVTVEIAGVEEIPAKSMKNVVSRGFAPLHKAMLITRKQVPTGGRYFHLKGDGWANELASVPSQLFSFWSPSLLGRYKLPEVASEMAIVLTEKTAD